MRAIVEHANRLIDSDDQAIVGAGRRIADIALSVLIEINPFDDDALRAVLAYPSLTSASGSDRRYR